MLNTTEIQTIVDDFKKIPEIMAIYAYGSVVTGTTHPGSDLDLAILWHHDAAVDYDRMLKLSGEMEARLGRPVHVGILSREQAVHAKEVIAHGQPIFCREQAYCDSFCMYALAAYAELNERRQAVIRAYTAPDSVSVSESESVSKEA